MSWENFHLGEFEKKILSLIGQRVGKQIHTEDGIRKIIERMESTSSSGESRSSRCKNPKSSPRISSSGSIQDKDKKKVKTSEENTTPLSVKTRAYVRKEEEERKMTSSSCQKTKEKVLVASTASKKQKIPIKGK